MSGNIMTVHLQPFNLFHFHHPVKECCLELLTLQIIFFVFLHLHFNITVQHTAIKCTFSELIFEFLILIFIYLIN
jgi:hypothetical protein